MIKQVVHIAFKGVNRLEICGEFPGTDFVKHQRNWEQYVHLWATYLVCSMGSAKRNKGIMHVFVRWSDSNVD
jgi:hypothetical protein